MTHDDCELIEDLIGIKIDAAFIETNSAEPGDGKIVLIGNNGCRWEIDVYYGLGDPSLTIRRTRSSTRLSTNTEEGPDE